MKKLFLFAGLAGMFALACNNTASDEAAINSLREEAIAIHDEIMPQISAFDRHTIRIDSLLANLDGIYADRPNLDTVQLRADLTALKANLESATDNMMVWMTEFEPDPDNESTSETKAYYEEEIRKVKELKQQFEEVSKESADKLATFQ